MASSVVAINDGRPDSAKTLSLEEYLRCVYHPDHDFVDDHLEERNVGETKHGLLQVGLGFWFRSHREWGVRAVSELRTRVSSTRVRIPDVAVVLNDAALREHVRTTPAFIAIEILSPEDRMNRVLIRLSEFLDMGVPHIWLFDPEERAAFTYTKQGLRLVTGTRLEIANTPIYIDLPELFTGVLEGA